MNQLPGPKVPLVLSYLSLRKAVGIIGFALPFVLASGKCLFQSPGLQASISCYYYTEMRNVFVGSMCVIGVFLMSTKGYDRKDKIAGILACVFAVGVAFFPTNPCTGVAQHKLIGALHLSFAALLFLTLAYFSLVLFTKTDPMKIPTRQKRQRNAVYRICGYTILVCIFLIVVGKLPGIETHVEWLTPVFWLESIAVLAFGVSWLIKGETILKDNGT
ncbi:MAG: DUF998 domain-containing protein [Acidobacteria bacterium]|nr:MAG: DUF998 domain-containing protein [Acidobacteriota bacterium]